MNNDIAGGGPRKKPKIVYPDNLVDKPSIHELAADEDHDLGAVDASGPEADAAEAYVADHPKRQIESSQKSIGSEKIDSAPSARRAKLAWLGTKLTKTQKIVALAAAAVLIAGGVLAVLTIRSHQPQTIVVNSSPPPKPKPIYSPLSGLAVSAKEVKLPIIGVMIENTPMARPQSGLSDAGIVYEAIAEAGITRFLALYQESSPKNVGPVRSARPYFIRWADGYSAGYAHVGGSPEALSDIKKWNIRDMDEFGAAGTFHRISSRYAPHNMYTSMSKLRSLADSRGYKFEDFEGFSRKDDKPAATPTAKTISMNISYPDYNVRYVYRSTTNSYERYEGGAPHIDANTGKAVSPKNVVALVMRTGRESDGYHSFYDNIGSGTAYIFEDGDVVKGEWSKPSLTAALALTDANGRPIALNRGQTWITALGAASQLSYKP